MSNLSDLKGNLCNLDYLLSQGTTKAECDLNYKKKWYPYETILRITPKVVSQFGMEIEKEIYLNDLTKRDIDDYILQGYKLVNIFKERKESDKQKEQRKWTLEYTKGLFKNMRYTWNEENICLRQQPLIQINDEISCGEKQCFYCRQWHTKDNWQKYKNRLLRWEEEINPKKQKKTKAVKNVNLMMFL